MSTVDKISKGFVRKSMSKITIESTEQILSPTVYKRYIIVTYDDTRYKHDEPTLIVQFQRT